MKGFYDSAVKLSSIFILFQYAENFFWAKLRVYEFPNRTTPL